MCFGDILALIAGSLERAKSLYFKSSLCEIAFFLNLKANDTYVFLLF